MEAVLAEMALPPPEVAAANAVDLFPTTPGWAELRHMRIREALEQAAETAGPGVEVVVHTLPAPAPAAAARSEAERAALVASAELAHDPALVALLLGAYAEWHALTSRFPKHPFHHDYLVHDFASPEEGLLPAQTLNSPSLLCRPSRHLFGRLSFHAQDRYCPIGPSTAADLLSDLQVVTAAVEASLKPTRPAAYALTKFAGHHSTGATFGGFCYLNHAAIAARMLQQRLAPSSSASSSASSSSAPRVCVLDIDYHAGNGTMAIFWEDPSVLTISLHADPDLDYPFNAGFADQTGHPERAPNSALNLPMPPQTSAADYKARYLAEAVPRIRAFAPAALVVSLGLDTMAGDHVQNPEAGILLEPEDMADLARPLRELGLPAVVIQEGGYNVDRSSRAVRCFLTALAGLDAGA